MILHSKVPSVWAENATCKNTGGRCVFSFTDMPPSSIVDCILLVAKYDVINPFCALPFVGLRDGDSLHDRSPPTRANQSRNCREDAAMAPANLDATRCRPGDPGSAQEECPGDLSRSVKPMQRITTVSPWSAAPASM